MSNATDYNCASQQRILKVMLVLFGHELQGLSPSDVAKACGISGANATRDISNLVSAGLAERLPDSDRIRISPMLARKCVATLQAFDRAQSELSTLAARYGAAQ